jgi:hypothetical protein
MKKSIIIIGLIVIGILIIISAMGILLYPNLTSEIQKELLPPRLVGLSLNQAIFGPEAITGVIQLHGVDFPLEDAAIGQYGTQGEITLWVSVEPEVTTATDLIDLMTEKINLGRSPFSFPVVKQFGDTPVYLLEGLGQQHYYWQAGHLVIWLAAEYEMADQVLKECLAFYR